MEQYFDVASFNPMSRIMPPLILFESLLKAVGNLQASSAESAKSSILSHSSSSAEPLSIPKEEQFDIASASAKSIDEVGGIKPPKKLALKAHWIYIRRQIFSKVFESLEEALKKKIRSIYNSKNQNYSKREIMAFFKSNLETVLIKTLDYSRAPTDPKKQDKCGFYLIEEEFEIVEKTVRLDLLRQGILHKSVETLYWEDEMHSGFMSYIKPKKNKSISLMTYCHLSLVELVDALQTRRPQNSRPVKKRKLYDLV